MSKKKESFEKSDKSSAAKPLAGKKNQPGVTLGLKGVSRRGWKVIGIGVGIVAVGFYVLSLTDPAGQNWASNLSPFLLLGGYATIGVGIILPDPHESAEKISEKK